MATEIRAFRCPSCGSGTSIELDAARFGYAFICAHCSTRSVVIIDRQLYVPQPGEHVCTACGLVASRKSRYCQCGSSLVKPCVKCQKEFPVDHALCDQCGWPQDVQPY